MTQNLKKKTDLATREQHLDAYQPLSGMVVPRFAGISTFMRLPHLAPAQAPGEIDIAITRALSPERSKNRQSRVLLRDPLVAVLPQSRKLKSKKIRLADLANERFILFHRKGAPVVFDTIVGACRSHGFSPRVENEPNSMQTILSLVEAEEGVAIVPASTSSLRSNGVQFVRLVPNNLYLDLIAMWPLGEPSAVLRTFLDFLSANADAIRTKAELALSSIARIKS